VPGGKAVLITGASSGIGLECAVHLAERGFDVYATVRDLGRRQALDAEAARRGVAVRVLPLDVTDGGSVAAAVEQVRERAGGVFGLVNNAGIVLRGCFEDLADAEIRRVFETNVFGTMSVTRAVLPLMRAAGGGRVVITTSVGGRVGCLAVSAYCASKFALEGFGEALAQEVAPYGVSVSLVAPAIVRTPVWEENRGVARASLDPASPYHRWFVGEERLADRLLRSSATAPADVAGAIARALTAPRPRLRYLVGRRAARVLRLRRLLPGEWFERIYFGAALRGVSAAARARGR
jgi:NAD(P)-dependent dehydrogenase (short-subunit alcohol dehydrogenase family)